MHWTLKRQFWVCVHIMCVCITNWRVYGLVSVSSILFPVAFIIVGDVSDTKQHYWWRYLYEMIMLMMCNVYILWKKVTYIYYSGRYNKYTQWIRVYALRILILIVNVQYSVTTTFHINIILNASTYVGSIQMYIIWATTTVYKRISNKVDVSLEAKNM